MPKSADSGTRLKSGSTLLLFMALLYVAAEWAGAAKLGGGRIFAVSRMDDQAEFRELQSRLATATQQACTGGVRRLLFLDGDVEMPYMKLAGDRIGGCEAVHETGVTPFSDADLARCDSALVVEYAPPLKPEPEEYLALAPEMTGAGWSEMSRWVSDDRRFGFAVYRRTCATDEVRP